MTRFEDLKKMHQDVMDDERAYAEWVELVPDGADDDDLKEIADDDDLYDAAAALYKAINGGYHPAQTE